MERKDLLWFFFGYWRNIFWYLFVWMLLYMIGVKLVKYCFYWNVWMFCLFVKVGRVNFFFLFLKKWIKNNIFVYLGVLLFFYKRSGFRNWFCYVFLLDILEMIFYYLVFLFGFVIIICV